MHTIIKTACQHIANDGFDSFYYSLVDQMLIDMPTTYTAFRDRSNHGTLPLTSQADALLFSMAYDKGHYATFSAVLDDTSLFESHTDDVINIIDYGCGQANATLATLEYISQNRDPEATHLNIHLIEPSSISLENAVFKVRAFAQNYGFSFKITHQNCKFDKAELPDFDNGYDTLHLMSYILDVREVQQQLHSVAKQIMQFKGKNYVVATSVNLPLGHTGMALLAHHLGSKTPNIRDYNPTYHRYNIRKGTYGYYKAQAIGMFLTIDNSNVNTLVA